MARVYVRLPSDTYINVGENKYDRDRSIGGNDEEYTVRLPDNTTEYTVTQWFDVEPTFENGLTATKRVASTVVVQVGATADEIRGLLYDESESIVEDVVDWDTDQAAR